MKGSCSKTNPLWLRGRGGFVLPLAIIALSGILLLLISLLSLVSLERKTARAYSNMERADYALVAGEDFVIGQITDFLERPDVTGAAFTTWAYHPGGSSSPGSLLALTAGRPEFDDGTTGGSPYLSADNTQWLGTVDGDPDALLSDFSASDLNPDIIDFNEDGALGEINGACLARWQSFGTDSKGRENRFAVWVDDETSRLDVTRIGTEERADGTTPAEIPFFEIGELDEEDAEDQEVWLTADTARVFLGETSFPTDLAGGATSFSRGYDVLAFTPSFADAGATQANGYDLPLRGLAKRNLNWNGNLTGDGVDERVERLMEWMSNGAEGFFNKRNLDYWTGSGEEEPKYTTIDPVNPFAANLRKEQFRTIAASLIDYLDTDAIPTQPESLADLDYGNPDPGAAPVLLMQDVPRPEFFGADRTVRINEVQIIWNSEGEVDGFEARDAVSRTSLGGGLFRYEIPVTYRFELWNMDDNEISASSYDVRSTYIQQILGSAFGSLGAEPIPEETEIVFQLNSGNPIGFAPNEVKVFDITRTYVRESNLDRGNTWRIFKDSNSNKQPDGHTRQAYVLLDAGTGEWLHATNYLQMSEAPTDGVVSVGPGNSGTTKGNFLNDPRMTPLRMYDETSTLISHDTDRDWSGNKPGTMGFVNNKNNGKDYQNFDFWVDRPYYQDLKTPLQGVTRVENRPMHSPGELGRLFDPAWTHPAGRGRADSPFSKGMLSPFRGGGSLAIGQSSIATESGTEEADQLDAKPWNLMDIFAIEGDGTVMNEEEFASTEWDGKVSLNCQKSFVLSDGSTKTNHEFVMELPSLLLGESSRPTDFDFETVAAELKNRMTKDATRPDGSSLDSWQDALPLYSTGQLSELESWKDTGAFIPTESNSTGGLELINRSDASREEVVTRMANLVTTRSHCYRIVVAGEVLASNGDILGRQMQEKVLFFECTWDTDTGELLSVKPETLYARSF